ncbi:MAG: PBP1A family penicillin-binding protein, partial [Nitratireductor sp.]|nr:PBP1A family penicillin-binding protein [Nitratireductor sp.]
AQLPQMSTWNVPERPPNARIVSVDGELLANRGATGGEAMRLDEMSPYLPLAVIAIEDRRFKSHFGLDPLGLSRAFVTNLVTGRLVQGGSTLTQQLAKNLFLEPERTLERKVQEAVLAVWLETKFSKDQILELYLNRVYFGAGAFGVDAAARRYFGKSARDLNLAEAATIAGLLKAPSRLSPARDPKAAEERAQVVLGAMRREGFVTDREAAQAMSMQPGRAKRYWSGSQHYVADMIMQQLPALIGKVSKDVIVDTTVDLDLQRNGEEILREMLDGEGAKKNVSQAALVALDGTGAIRALIGGREYSQSQFNRATDAKRQPGSAFKPIVYLAALEAGRSPDSVRQDAPVKIGNWTPENYDRKYRGPVTLSDGLTQSLNTIAAQLVMEVGPKTVVETAHRLGIRSELQRNASIALGTSEVSLLELVGAYAPFSNGGYGVTPFLIRRVTTVDGEVLYERNAPPEPQVVRSRELGMMNSMLMRVVNSGTGKAARIPGWQTAGKTGTTQNSRDALF